MSLLIWAKIQWLLPSQVSCYQTQRLGMRDLACERFRTMRLVTQGDRCFHGGVPLGPVRRVIYEPRSYAEHICINNLLPSDSVPSPSAFTLLWPVTLSPITRQSLPGPLRLDRLLEGRLRLVESPWLDLGLEQLVKLTSRQTGISCYLSTCDDAHPAGSGMMNHEAMANGAPSPV